MHPRGMSFSTGTQLPICEERTKEEKVKKRFFPKAPQGFSMHLKGGQIEDEWLLI